MTPSQLQQIYGFSQLPSTSTGAGTTIAIIDFGDDPSIRSDLATFDQALLPNTTAAQNPNLTIVSETGSNTLPPTADADATLETALDVEYAHAIAPAASLLLIEMNVSEVGGTPSANANIESHILTAVDTARNYSGVDVVSMSFGLPETSADQGNNVHFMTPNYHTGVEFVAATGDSGGPPMWPSSSPQVLAVGGTTLNPQGNNSYTETGWSFGDPVPGSSSGGISQYQLEPAAQRVVQGLGSRTVPDVSYNAGYPIEVHDSQYPSGPWLGVGGTSAGAPQWAGLISLADQARITANTPTLEGLNPIINPATVNYSSYYRDITSGSNGSYSAGTGYDLVTGLGSPLANTLVPELAAETYAQPAQVANFDPAVGDWFTQPSDGSSYETKTIFGNSGDYPVPGDYDAIGHSEQALYSNESQTWYINTGSSTYDVQFGGPGDIPVPGDYTHSGHMEIAVFRPSTDQWFILPNFGPQYGGSNQGPGGFVVQFGGPGDDPVPADYTGSGHAEIAIFRPSTDQWEIDPTFGPQYGGSNQGPGGFVVQFGGPGAVPVPADYTGLNHADVAVYYPLNSNWAIDPTFGPQYGGSNQGPGGFVVDYGGPGDIPVPGNFGGHASIAVYRPDDAEWDIDPDFGAQYGGSNQGPDGYVISSLSAANFVPVSSALPISYGESSGLPAQSIIESLGSAVVPLATSLPYQIGASNDLPVPADFGQDGTGSQAYYRATTGQWYLPNATVTFGGGGDDPVPADYDGVNHAEIAVYRPSTSQWIIATNYNSNAVTSSYAVQFGGPGDIPVPGDYTGAGHADLAFFRPSTAQWFIATAWNQSTGAVTSYYVVQWGSPGDIPVPGEYNGGHVELAVYRPSTAQWFIATTYNTTNGSVTASYSDQYGSDGGIPVPGDFTGAGHADLAFYNTGNAQANAEFFIAPNFSSSGVGSGSYTVAAGNENELPSPGAFSGGKKSKVSVFDEYNDTYSIIQ